MRYYKLMAYHHLRPVCFGYMVTKIGRRDFCRDML
jgi:hypothetical protein